MDVINGNGTRRDGGNDFKKIINFQPLNNNTLILQKSHFFLFAILTRALEAIHLSLFFVFQSGQ